MQNRGNVSAPAGKPLRDGAEVEVTQRIPVAELGSAWGREWEAVDESSLASFPASDAPAHGAYTSPTPRLPLFFTPPLYRVMLAAFALGGLIALLRRRAR